jgi:hypothetical protein
MIEKPGRVILTGGVSSAEKFAALDSEVSRAVQR